MAYQKVTEMPEHVFRLYDIRGVVDKELTPDGVYTLGLALGHAARAGRVRRFIVGRDGRLSGPQLSEALMSGVQAAGVDVLDIGVVTTPMLYYAVEQSEFRSGVMLSGSHNPPEYNGFKIMMFGRTWYGDDIKSFYQAIKSGSLTEADKPGERTQRDIKENYLGYIARTVKLARPLKIIIDCGNGISGPYAPELMRRLGCQVTTLFEEVDGRFPNHTPDPAVPANLQPLIQAVKEQKADVGLAFDGDADRVGIITEQGEIISADRLLLLLALDLLKRQPGAAIVYDVKCGRYLKTMIEASGGRPIMNRTGHSLIKSTMRQQQAELGGELSGHIFMKENWYNFDDGIYVASRFLELLARHDQTASELFESVPKDYATPELKIDVTEAEKFSLMEKIIAEAHDVEGGVVTTIDGLRIDWPDGFGLIRPSNTSPYLAGCFAAGTEARLAEIEAWFKALVAKVKPDAVWRQ